MNQSAQGHLRRDLRKGWRITCTIVAIVVVEAMVFGLSLLPVVAFLTRFLSWLPPTTFARTVATSVLLAPSYAVFALCLMGVSALATRVTGARTPPAIEIRVGDMDWTLMRWVRYMVATHLVRVFAGHLYRGSPIWTAYLRMNGARIGRRVYVNTVHISDHNLLEFGDDVVIGGGVHLSGHTVERGVLKTGTVRLGPRVTIGLNTVVDIDVEIGANCQVGVLSLVPKRTSLPADSVYAGVPVARIR
jgi:acetyltransferase-like isoleucine patch superfamily enzyme